MTGLQTDYFVMRGMEGDGCRHLAFAYDGGKAVTSQGTETLRSKGKGWEKNATN